MQLQLFQSLKQTPKKDDWLPTVQPSSYYCLRHRRKKVSTCTKWVGHAENLSAGVDLWHLKMVFRVGLSRLSLQVDTEKKNNKNHRKNVLKCQKSTPALPFSACTAQAWRTLCRYSLCNAMLLANSEGEGAGHLAGGIYAVPLEAKLAIDIKVAAD